MTDRYSALTVTFWASVTGTLFTLPLAAGEIMIRDFTFPDQPLVWWGVVYLGAVSTALAFFLWAKGFELMKAGTAGLFFFVQPVVGTFLGWLVLHETLTWPFFAGSALILGSVLFAMRSEKR